MEEVLASVLERWGAELKCLRKDLVVAGSPERSLGRCVVETVEGERFILERVGKGAVLRKEEMARLQARLFAAGLPVRGPLAFSSGSFLLPYGGQHYQLTPYTRAEPLRQPDYIYDGWRGAAVAELLLKLRRLSLDAKEFTSDSAFDIFAYIDALMVTMARFHPRVFEAAQEAVGWLSQRLKPHWGLLPTALAHGDVHAVNILWGKRGKDEIRAVIDWEFFGEKPLLYDVANMVGCCGIENPEGLVRGLAPALVSALRSSEFADDMSWRLFVEQMVALRFAWLSEWLRKEDTEMINLELSYIYLLIDNHKSLLSHFSLGE
ncbi:MAG: phosphotransferase [Desulfobacterales bacterium]|nr:phosphotransferase [Desulfobacterales bacterium]